MSVESYLEDEVGTLLSHPFVAFLRILKYRVNRLDGYFRAECSLMSGDRLEIALRVSEKSDGVQIDSYRYQWMRARDGSLRRRWDNAPHYRDLPGFPHHCHVGSAVEPSSVLRVVDLLRAIETLVSQENT